MQFLVTFQILIFANASQMLKFSKDIKESRRLEVYVIYYLLKRWQFSKNRLKGKFN